MDIKVSSYNKIVRVIDSCKTVQHREIAGNMIRNFYHTFKDMHLADELHEHLINKQGH